MYSRQQLGIAPLVAAEIIKDGPTVLASLAKLFGENGSYDQTHARILQLVQVILADPDGAVSGHYLPGDGRWLESAANAYMALRCWAGDQSILAAYRQVSGDPAQNGCGCETAFGCRADAQHALQQVDAQLNRTMQTVSSAPIPSGVSTTPGGTVFTTLPGGIQIGLPVPASTITGATVFGVPVLAIAAGIALIAFTSGRGRR